jgi:hypothetical protein
MLTATGAQIIQVRDLDCLSACADSVAMQPGPVTSAQTIQVSDLDCLSACTACHQAMFLATGAQTIRVFDLDCLSACADSVTKPCLLQQAPK